MTALRETAVPEHPPDQVEIEYAEQLQDFVAALMQDGETACLSIANGNGGAETVTLTPALTKALLDALDLISCGKEPQMIPPDTHFSTEEAAYMLNAVHPYVLKLLDDGTLPYFQVGPIPCIPAQKLFAYRKRMKAGQLRALKEIARFDQENNLL